MEVIPQLNYFSFKVCQIDSRRYLQHKNKDMGIPSCATLVIPGFVLSDCRPVQDTRKTLKSHLKKKENINFRPHRSLDVYTGSEQQWFSQQSDVAGKGAEGGLPPTAELFVTDSWSNWKCHVHPIHTHKLRIHSLMGSSYSMLTQMARLHSMGHKTKQKVMNLI